MTEAYDKLKRLLGELFQFDRADLDFGIYRIMNRRREEVSSFLDDWGVSKKELEDRHVLFQNDDPGTYIEKMLNRIVLQKREER